MGCLSSAQASPSVMTIETRQRSNASSLPLKHEQSRVHEERSWIESVASEEQSKGKAQIETKPDVFVLRKEDTQEEEEISRSEECIKLYNETKPEENVIYNVEEETTDTSKTSQSAPALPIQEHKMDMPHSKEQITPQPSDVLQRQEVDDVTAEYPTAFSSSRNKSEDTDSGFENPEIASVSAYSPDDNSDDDMF